MFALEAKVEAQSESMLDGYVVVADARQPDTNASTVLCSGLAALIAMSGAKKSVGRSIARRGCPGVGVAGRAVFTTTRAQTDHKKSCGCAKSARRLLQLASFIMFIAKRSYSPHPTSKKKITRLLK